LTEYCLGYWRPLVFPYKFNGWFFNLFDECHWNFEKEIEEDYRKWRDLSWSWMVESKCLYSQKSLLLSKTNRLFFIVPIWGYSFHFIESFAYLLVHTTLSWL
jgi:hypothetical protein